MIHQVAKMTTEYAEKLKNKKVKITSPESYYNDSRDYPIGTVGTIARLFIKFTGQPYEQILFQIDTDASKTTENSIIHLYQINWFDLLE